MEIFHEIPQRNKQKIPSKRAFTDAYYFIKNELVSNISFLSICDMSRKWISGTTAEGEQGRRLHFFTP
jgi:hypothetical protein